MGADLNVGADLQGRRGGVGANLDVGADLQGGQGGAQGGCGGVGAN